jgi:hypothetical protein
MKRRVFLACLLAMAAVPRAVAAWRRSSAPVGSRVFRGGECWIPVPLAPPAPRCRTFSDNGRMAQTCRSGNFLDDLWTDNLGSPLRHSLFNLFSRKLWTVLDQYGAGGPCMMAFVNGDLGTEFEKAIA